jgi:hypothetical protein
MPDSDDPNMRYLQIQRDDGVIFRYPIHESSAMEDLNTAISSILKAQSRSKENEQQIRTGLLSNSERSI